MRLVIYVSAILIALRGAALPEWSVETVTDERTGRQQTRALLHEVGGRATLLIQCSQQAPEPVLYLHEAVNGTHLSLIYRFDDDEPQSRMAQVSSSGHVVRIWNEVERNEFADARELRIQLRPFVVFHFDLRGIEALAPKLKC